MCPSVKLCNLSQFSTPGVKETRFKSSLVALPENNGFSFYTFDDPAVIARAKAVGPAVVGRAPDLSDFTV